MAIGGDLTLTGGTFSPGPPRPAPPGWPTKPQPQQKPAAGGANPYGQAPGMIGDDVVQGVVNNQLAQSAGAGMSSMQGMDRAGMSRGKGQRSRADMAQSVADVSASGAANRTQMGVASANAKTQRAYDNTMRMEQLGTKGLLEGLRANRAREGLTERGWAQDVYEALANGQFNLDGIQLDPSSFLRSLMG